MDHTHYWRELLLDLWESCCYNASINHVIIWRWAIKKYKHLFLFTFFLWIDGIKWRPSAFVSADPRIWCCCCIFIEASPNYDLKIRDQSYIYKFYDLQKKDPITVHQSWANGTLLLFWSTRASFKLFAQPSANFAYFGQTCDILTISDKT